MADLYLMCGICGSGKSYFSKQFAALNGFRYLNVDDCYAVMNGDERIHENKFDVWQLYYKLIYQANELGQTAVVDTNAPYRSDREEILNWFSGFEKHRLIWVSADAPCGRPFCALTMKRIHSSRRSWCAASRSQTRSCCGKPIF